MMEVDITQNSNEKLQECEKLAKEGKLNEALEILYVIEKHARTACDAPATARILVSIIRLCFQAAEWDMLNENIVLLTKRRSQLKQAVAKMVQEAFTFVDQTPAGAIKLKLIEVLRQVTDGKIYVEVERARLTRILSEMKEKEGNIDEAARLLQELQVETYGSMDKREKVEFILEQMRLCLARKDYIRAQIISKKISPKFFSNDEAQDLKLKFYELSISLAEADSAYIKVCQYYSEIYNTPIIRESENKWKEALQKMVIYGILTPSSHDQKQMILRISQDKNLEKILKYKELLDCFISQEIVLWNSITTRFQEVILKGCEESPNTNLFETDTDDGRKRWASLKERVVEHNIIVIASYYTSIKLGRLAELLHLTVAETETFISNLVISRTIFARIDRPAGIVNFIKICEPDLKLNEWSTKTRNLMGLINKTTYMINREEMLKAKGNNLILTD
ncbi:uncharacterized protein TRIADDRAFT_35460 [Trichoplax adhaerens]|uniref:PCI domain-containing protein n=1 Tax=Trichoplax adhaerens TaxID=10228 RepID=B3RNB0_TRIAD|nr:hypothetical protein TRIADDRAFT_35460 [Trichoplax adhaerens]EDV27422.1 hypothetical protein TRIADDRAFT_35460 [Trichoplax adhaerens]|eukprot:XP_002109256.1 hypothetical protein TRIADDRAFT_35460 [Trichoplax adhaerens]